MKIRVAGETIDTKSDKTYSSQEVYALVTTSFYNGANKDRIDILEKIAKATNEIILSIGELKYVLEDINTLKVIDKELT